MRATRLALAATLALSACATAPRPEVRPRVWPAAPSAARIAWVASFPDERSGGPARGSWWRALSLFLGLDDGPQPKGEPLLSRPFGLAATDRELVVADPDGHRVVRVDWHDGRFEQLTCAAPWVMPLAVAVGPDSSVFVADGGAGRVVRISEGKCTMLGEGVLTRPSGLALAGHRLYVVDPPRHAVVVFSLDGQVVARIGARGEGEGELNYPTAIAAVQDHALLVVDALNFRIVSYSRDGTAMFSFGRAGERDGAFARPKGVAVDAAGRIYVTDAQLGVVLVFDGKGEFEFAFGGSGVEPYDFSLPAGIAVSGDKLFVADPYHHRVEMFEILPEEAR